MRNRQRTAITLEKRPGSRQGKRVVRADRFAAARTTAARVQRRWKVWLGWDHDVDTLPQRVGDVDRIVLGAIRRHERVALRVLLRQRVELIVPTPVVLLLALLLALAPALIVRRRRRERVPRPDPVHLDVALRVRLRQRLDRRGRVPRPRPPQVERRLAARPLPMRVRVKFAAAGIRRRPGAFFQSFLVLVFGS